MHNGTHHSVLSAGTKKAPLPTFASFGEESKAKTSSAQDGWAAF